MTTRSTGDGAAQARAYEVSVHDGVADVVLNGPNGNALGAAFWSQTADTFSMLAGDDSVRAIVLSGSPPNFTFGLDLKWVMGVAGEAFAAGAGGAERTAFMRRLERMQDALVAIATCRKPVIAAISGWCVGAGIDIICAADVRVCSRDAMFSARAVRIGIVEDMGSLQRLPAIVGEGAARELLLTGDDFDAARAHELRLVSHVYDSPADALGGARAIATRIAENPPLAVQGVKQVMNERALDGVAESLRFNALWNAAFIQSHDFSEAIAAFAEKRKPKFEGR